MLYWEEGEIGNSDDDSSGGVGGDNV